MDHNQNLQIVSFFYLYINSYSKDFAEISESMNRLFQLNYSTAETKNIFDNLIFSKNISLDGLTNLMRRLNDEIKSFNSCIYPPVQNCTYCDKKLSFKSKKKVIIYKLNGAEMSNIISNECKSCEITFSLNTFEINRSKERYFYPPSIKITHFETSLQTIFETRLLMNFDEFLSRNHVPFDGFCDTYNIINISELNNTLRPLDRRRLSEAWFSWKIAMYEHKFGTEYLLHFGCKNTDKLLESRFEFYKRNIILSWHYIHLFYCKSTLCSKISSIFLYREFIFLFLVFFILSGRRR
jgi:hypothetical protein